MLNLDELEAESGVVQEIPEKIRLQQEKALRQRKEREERRYNMKKEKLLREFTDQKTIRLSPVNPIYDKFAYEITWPIVMRAVKQKRGQFEMVSDVLDRRIRLLEDTIQGRNIRFDLLNRIVIETIDSLLRKHEMNMETLTADFMSAKNKLLTDRRHLCQAIILRGKQLRDEIRITSYCHDNGDKAMELVTKHEKDLKIFNELCSRRFDSLYNDYEKRIMDKWIEYKNMFEDYKAKSKEYRFNIGLAKKNDLKENKEIQGFKLKRKMLEQNLQAAAAKEISTEDMDSLKETRECVKLMEPMVRDMYRLQNRLNAEDKRQSDHFNKVTDKVLRELKAIRALGEKVVRLRRICSPMETEQMKETEGLNMEYGVLRAEALKQLTARVQAENSLMAEKLREAKNEQKALKKKVREVLSKLGSAKEKRELTLSLQCLQCS